MTHKPLAPALFLAITAFAATSPQASLMNGNFATADPFEGWTGLVSDCDDLNCTNDVDIDVTTPADFSTWSANFGTPVDGKVTLSTTWDATQTWAVQLSQVFTVPNLVMGTSGYRLEMVLGFDPSDPWEYGVAQLTDPNDNNNLLLDLLAGDRDLTAYAGQEVEILFRIEDFDGPVDTMTLGNIRVQGVPAPAPVLLLAVGLAALSLRRRAS